ncbi:carotenoid oxygenase family protein [Mycobacterium koreense]|nr:carotenoid oxygenase family protein [Mycolicibacillus koreensis]MCV7248227.1 carotenoid oxygenase family protein [Mycolicibacillus koreensis]ODR09452.1 hypothetical protein BHQ15_06605 [Mycolicibacillus koreensis]BBY55164.1 hypothetical protein MKOR_24150 [Mycolicibacillus koreensis]
MDQALQEHRRNPIFVDTADIPETPEPVELEIDGTVPGELSGILYRNGPVRFEGGGFAAQHPFDGDGLVCRYRLDGGRITFRSRYVRTRKFTQIQNGRGADVKGIGNRLPGWWRNHVCPQIPPIHKRCSTPGGCWRCPMPANPGNSIPTP